ncbi:MAG TPA: hypothetical protein V6C81_25500 [Planktothrix sp.]|jgi:hypothetical protein
MYGGEFHFNQFAESHVCLLSNSTLLIYTWHDSRVFECIVRQFKESEYIFSRVLQSNCLIHTHFDSGDSRCARERFCICSLGSALCRTIQPDVDAFAWYRFVEEADKVGSGAMTVTAYDPEDCFWDNRLIGQYWPLSAMIGQLIGYSLLSDET